MTNLKKVKSFIKFVYIICMVSDLRYRLVIYKAYIYELYFTMKVAIVKHKISSNEK